MSDLVSHLPNTLDAPAQGGYAIVPHDTNNYPIAFRSIWVGVTGNVSVFHIDGTTAVYKNVPVGPFPVRGLRVNITNTTASEMVGMY